MAADPKETVTRLIEEVINGGDLELIEELHVPEMVGPARRWIVPFRTDPGLAEALTTWFGPP